MGMFAEAQKQQQPARKNPMIGKTITGRAIGRRVKIISTKPTASVSTKKGLFDFK